MIRTETLVDLAVSFLDRARRHEREIGDPWGIAESIDRPLEALEELLTRINAGQI